jgi:hypothetical protein
VEAILHDEFDETLIMMEKKMLLVYDIGDKQPYLQIQQHDQIYLFLNQQSDHEVDDIFIDEYDETLIMMVKMI